jgi:gamma-glutamyl-gamma-aminobutyrate hydrolase PuuD
MIDRNQESGFDRAYFTHQIKQLLPRLKITCEQNDGSSQGMSQSAFVVGVEFQPFNVEHDRTA